MEEKAEHFKKYLGAALIFLLLLLILFCVQGYLGGHFSSAEQLQAYMKRFGVFAPVILTVIQAIQVIIPILPGWLGCVVGAGMFGAAGGFWCNYIGISAGSIISFLLAKRYGVELVRKMVPMEKYQKLVDWVNTKKSYTLILFLAILLPLAPDDFLCWFSGLTGMGTRKFTWIIISAKPWCILVYSLIFGHII